TVACVALGAVLAAIPFIADYARKQDEALDERQRSIEALAQTAAASAEQISIAAAGLHGLAEASAKNLKLAEQLSARLQEKTGEAKQSVAKASSAENEILTQQLAELRKVAAELAKQENAAQKNFTAARDEFNAKSARALERFDAKIAELFALIEKFFAQKAESIHTPRFSPPEIPSAPRITPIESPAISATSESSEETNGSAETMTVAEPAIEVKKPSPRKRAAKRPKAAEEPEPTLGLEAEATPAPSSEATATVVEESLSAPAAPISSEDGATRLFVTSYIGIGNKLFLRGEGPGLSWDKGVPLQFVSIGKWRWETHDAASPVRAKLYKNDDIECAALGTLTVEPGRQAEVTAAF
ncbi:MAG: hypothetical protein KGJ37_03855, partial [Verrucomicrobiota bacterium]|nr:hypothetical protein [Verrucomicrobiota bacterium]